MRSGILLLLAIVMPLLLAAQTNTVTPFPSEEQASDRLFSLDEKNTNYRFTAELPGSNFLIIEWGQLSTWQDKGDLQHIIALAKQYYSGIQDSFTGSTSAKRLDIHIPISGEPATVMYCEHAVANKALLVKGKIQAPLKMNMDTIRILRTLSEKEIRKETKLMQMQYTFLLKDIDQIKTLEENKMMTDNISHTFDSVIVEYRKRWYKQDKWTHNLNVNYHPLSNDPKKRVDVKRLREEDNSGRFYKASEVEWRAGVTLLHNTLCPVLDLGYSYKWQSKEVEYSYVRGSLSQIYQLRSGSSGNPPNSISFFNIEYGWLKNKKNTFVPIHGASFGLGYAYNPKNTSYYNPLFEEHIVRAFFSYKVSKLMTVNLDNFSYLQHGNSFTITCLFRFL